MFASDVPSVIQFANNNYFVEGSEHKANCRVWGKSTTGKLRTMYVRFHQVTIIQFFFLSQDNDHNITRGRKVNSIV